MTEDRTAAEPAAGEARAGRAGWLLRLGRFTARRSGAVLIAALLMLIGVGAYGAGAQDALELSRCESPGTESVRVGEVLREEYGTGNPNLALLVTAREGNVDSAAVAATGRSLAREVADHAMVTDVTSYWDGRSAALRSADGMQALLLARLEGSASDTRAELATLSPQLARTTDAVTVEVGGQEEISRQVSAQARADFLTAELLVLPAVLLLLILVYRRTVAALLTVGVGLLSVLGTLAGLRLLALLTPVSTFAANIALVLGLGLGIDYSLFVINRYREERAAGRARDAAVARTVATAGRTVVFSGVTVAVSLSALLVFPFFFLSSFAYAGALVVASAVAGAVCVLPAALARWGHRVERVVRPSGDGTVPAAGDGRPTGGGSFWHRTALRAMRRPVLSGGLVLGVLLLAGSPLLGLRFGLPDERILPEGTSSRVTSERIHQVFPAEPTDTMFVVADGGPRTAENAAGPGGPRTAENAGGPGVRPAGISAYAAELSRIPGVFQVDSPVGSHRDGRLAAPPVEGAADARTTADSALFAVVPTQEAMRGNVPDLVAAVRAVPAPFDTAVGGYPAETTDFRATLLDRLPIVVALILLATFVILFLMTGSLLLPAKATVLNLLSLSVMFGCLVWVFQEGNLSGVLGFTPTGSIEPSIPVLMFCIAFGLSMDYEVFMLSRIKEEYEVRGNTEQAVAAGLRSTAPLITAAAGILALSFASYATGGVVFLKELGIGTALTILVDATLIRVVLLPVSMRLAGRANWWAPGPLRRLHARFGLREGGVLPGGEGGARAPVREREYA